MHSGPTGRRRVLVVAPELPHAPLTGAHIRPLSIVRALARGHEVTVVGAAPEGADLSALRETRAQVRALETRPYERSSVGGTLSRARQAVTPVPLLPRSRFEAMGRHVQEAITATQPDALHLVSMYSCWYRDPRLPAVMDLLDVVSGLCEAAAAAQPVRYSLARLQRRTSAAIERRELARMAAVMTINGEDQARLRRLGIASTVVPLAVDVPPEPELEGYVAPGAGDGETRERGPADALEVLFVGDFLHHPNRASAAFIARELAPALARRRLPVALTVAGRAAGLVRDASANGAIRYLDDVPDLAPLYRQTDVVLVPVPFGGGTKNKTLEALAWGKAVVGTPQAFTGIDVRPGLAFLSVPRDAAIMTQALARLARDAGLRASIGRVGREYVLRNHTQDIVDERVTRVYERVLGARQ